MIKSWNRFNEFKDNEDLTNKRVRLVKMADPHTKLKFGDEGTIKGVDGIGQIMVRWDSGSTLSLIPEEDSYIILD